MKIRFLIKLSIFGILLCVFMACANDDYESDDKKNTSIVDKSYTYDSFEIDGDGNPEEYHTRLSFISSSTCQVKVWGYDYIWSNGYKKNNFNETKSCSYSISGSKIILKKYPFYAFGDDLVLTNHGSYLEGDGNRYYKD